MTIKPILKFPSMLNNRTMIGDYQVYSIVNPENGIVLCNVFGPISAIASVAIIRYIESGKDDIAPRDMMSYIQQEEKKNDETNGC